MGDLTSISTPRGKKDLALVVPVLSPKGGTGKTFICANLAAALKAMDQRVLIYDAHPQFPQARILAHSEPSLPVTQFLEGKVPIERLIQRGLGGVDVLYAEWGGFPPLDPREVFPGINRALGQLLDQYDYLLIDVPSGWEENQKVFLSQGDRIVVTMTADLLSTAWLPTFLQQASVERPKLQAEILINRVFSPTHGAETFAKLQQSLAKLKNPPKISFLGYIVDDSRRAWESIQKRVPLTLLEQGGSLAGCFDLLAENFVKTFKPRGRMSFIENFLRHRGV